jgi:hypothetical protein
VERQVGYVRHALGSFDMELSIRVRGALRFPKRDGLPLVAQLRVRGIVIDGPTPIAKLVREPGPLKRDAIAAIGQRLADAFPPA